MERRAPRPSVPKKSIIEAPPRAVGHKLKEERMSVTHKFASCFFPSNPLLSACILEETWTRRELFAVHYF